MPSSPIPPDKKQRFSSPVLFFIIVGVIVAAITLFLVLRPNPTGTTNKSTASPASQK